MISTTNAKEVDKLKKQTACSMEEQFFGSVTVGERGQVVIPAEARKKLGISPGDKLLVMGHPFADGLVLVQIDSMQQYLSTFLEGLRGAAEKSVEPDTNGSAPENG